MLSNNLETLEDKKIKFKAAIAILILITMFAAFIINANECYDKTCDKGLKPTLLYPGVRCVCLGETK